MNDFQPGDSLSAYCSSFPVKSKLKAKKVRCRPSLCKPVCTGLCGRSPPRPPPEEPSPHSGPSFVIGEPGNFASSSNTRLVEVAGLGWFETPVTQPPVQSEPKEEPSVQSGPKEEQASSSSGAKHGAQPVPAVPGETEEVAKPGKRRRGKPRNRPGSNERRWNKLEEAGPP